MRTQLHIAIWNKATATTNALHVANTNAGNRCTASKILKTVVHAIRGKYVLIRILTDFEKI